MDYLGFVLPNCFRFAKNGICQIGQADLIDKLTVA